MNKPNPLISWNIKIEDDYAHAKYQFEHAQHYPSDQPLKIIIEESKVQQTNLTNGGLINVRG